MVDKMSQAAIKLYEFNLSFELTQPLWISIEKSENFGWSWKVVETLFNSFFLPDEGAEAYWILKVTPEQNEFAQSVEFRKHLQTLLSSSKDEEEIGDACSY